MANRHRRLMIAITVLVSLTLLAAPARGADWFGIYAGSHGFGLSFGSSDWTVYGSTWHDPYWVVDYDVALSGYGEWVWIGGLGRCWRPYVAAEWRPFTHGRWVWTSYGWTWVAYEPWGYFPHHYGHWALSHHGWVWAPGYVYHAANVIWVRAGGYLGWYASPPRGWSHAYRGHHSGYGRGYRNGYDHGYWDGWNDARYATYTEWRHLGSHNVSRHAVSADSVRRSHSSAVVRTSVTPPNRSEARRRGAVNVPDAKMEQRSVQAGNRTITVARPRGMAESIELNGRDTVNRALSSQGRRRAGEPTAGHLRKGTGEDRVRTDRRSGETVGRSSGRSPSQDTSGIRRESRRPEVSREPAAPRTRGKASAPTASRQLRVPAAPTRQLQQQRRSVPSVRTASPRVDSKAATPRTETARRSMRPEPSDRHASRSKVENRSKSSRLDARSMRARSPSRQSDSDSNGEGRKVRTAPKKRRR